MSRSTDAPLKLRDVILDGNMWRVFMETSVSGRRRRITVSIQGRRVADVQADDGGYRWTENAGDPRLTQRAIDKAFEEVARTRATLQILKAAR